MMGAEQEVKEEDDEEKEGEVLEEVFPRMSLI